MQKKTACLFVAASLLAGCSTIREWVTEEEELEIRRLDPIEQQFEIEPLWETSIGSGVDGYFSRMSPVESDGVIFMADRKGYLDALDAKTGKQLWRVDFATYSDEGWFSGINKLISRGQTARLSSLAAKDGKVYLGTENGNFYVLDAVNGSIVWETTIPGEILAPADVSDRVVAVNTGGGVLFAFNAETGEELWRSESDVPPLSLRGISSPLIANGGVIIGTPTGYIKVNVLDSGLTAWETAVAKPTGATELERIVDIDATPLIYGGVIYAISYNGTLAAVELRTGRIIWQREYGSYRNISIEDNIIYVVDVNSNVLALDRRNGIERWNQNSLKGRSLTSATPFGDHVVVGDNYGFLHWLNKETGKVDSRYDLGGDDDDASIFSDPIVTNNTLITVTREGDIAALKPQSESN